MNQEVQIDFLQLIFVTFNLLLLLKVKKSMEADKWQQKNPFDN